jgi:3-oxo-Delta1-steroid hydratase/dehydrogenase large subunit
MSGQKWIGQAVKRKEDPDLLTGKAQFIADAVMPGMLHMAILRSPYAHARITAIDAGGALALPGVTAVITGTDAAEMSTPLFGLPPGWSTYCLAVEKACYVGEPVAAVAAPDRYYAEDALEKITVEYEPLPVVTDPEEATAPGSPLVQTDKGSNVIYQRTFSFGEDTEAVFSRAAHTVGGKFRWRRVSGNPIETLGCLCAYDAASGQLTVWANLQLHTALQRVVAATLRLAPEKVRIRAFPQGGSFGAKRSVYKYVVMASLLALRTGRPVKWVEDRREHLVASSTHGSDRYYEAELAVDADGTIRGLRVKLLDDIGAYCETLGGALQVVKPLACLTGCYVIPDVEYAVTCVATNKSPQGAYRGFGPPVHNFVLERLVDMAARRLRLDPAAIRLGNFIPPAAFPYTIPSGNLYDSGDYPAVLRKALALVEYDRWRREQQRAREAGRYVGIGMATIVDVGVSGRGLIAFLHPTLSAAGGPEGVRLRVDGQGTIVVEVGYAEAGQGLDTIVVQVLADELGITPEGISVIHLDTASAPPSQGPVGSRGGVAIAGAVLAAARSLQEQALQRAAVQFGISPSSLEWYEGRVRVSSSPERTLSVAELAAKTPLRVEGEWLSPAQGQPDEQGRLHSYATAAAATHIAVVEVDIETGQIRILQYIAVDDCGTVLNPAIVEGMVQGGIAQGLGIALLEEHVYDEDGQLLNGTLMDYLLPTAVDVPHIETAHLVTPSPFTPFGAKGTGESSINGAPAAIANAISDALAPLGIEITELPVSPARLMSLIWAEQERATR